MKKCRRNFLLNLKFVLNVALLCWFVPFNASGQSFQVSGIVQGTDGPLASVSIFVKGTAIGSQTDNTGKFLISVSDPDAVLVFSLVGYQNMEVRVENRQTINVTLKPSVSSLDEVVVVGYGSQSRRKVTGSIVKVDMGALETIPNTNISQALRGRVTGVQFQDNGRPGQSGSIMIRGRSSISASNNPLIIVDGVFFNGNLADINPNDVSSMEVLKDATAASIYGSRAANGVILITTKLGNSEKPTISVNTYVGTSSWTKKLHLLSPERYIQKTLDFRAATDQEADPSKISEYLMPIEAENYLNGRTIDPWEEISQDAGVVSGDVSLSGGRENLKYYMSASYTDEQGLTFGDQAKRVSFRTNIDANITDWLRVGIAAQYSRRDLSGQEANLANGYWLSPFSQMYHDEERKQPVRFPSGETLAANPMFPPLYYKDVELYNNIFANFYGVVDFPFLTGLSYRLNASPSQRWNNRNTFRPNYTDNGYNVNSTAQKNISESLEYVIENILSYKNKFGSDHEVDVTLMYGVNKHQAATTVASGNEFFSDATIWDNLGLAAIQYAGSSASELAGISQMARINYGYRGKYLLTATIRRDGSSVFGENNKWGTFPSAALAWIISDEDFLKSARFLDFLKLRASYGKIGNQAVSQYSSLGRMGTVNYVYGDGSPSYVGIYPTAMGNAALRWETSLSTNFALDFALFGTRLNGSIEYYQTKTRDLLLRRAIPRMNGFSSLLQNLGSTSNRGIEFSLNTVNVRRKLFLWETTVNVSHNANKILALHGQDLDGDGIQDDDISNRWFIGKPVLVAYDYKVNGIYQEGDTDIPAGWEPGYTRIEDTNGDGVINADDRSVIGQLDPKVLWGIGNQFSYRNFSLYVFVNGQTGFIQQMMRLNPAGGNADKAVNMLDDGWWTPENASETKPRLNFTNPLGHGFYASRNFVRIQDVSLSYTLRTDLLQRLKINNLRLYVSGRNLHTFTKWPGWDPETGDAERTAFPVSRTFTLGLNLNL